MEERIGSVLLLVEDKNCISQLNDIISFHSEIVIGRQGIRLKDKGKSIISLVLEGTTDELGSLTGKLGKLNGVKVKSIVLKNN